MHSALWLIVQSTARFISNMPITLLEIHVLIQVVCTSFIYWWWWYKPLDVNEPVEITLVPVVDDVDPLPNLQQKVDFEAAIKQSLAYHTDAIFVTKKPSPDSIAIKSKAFFDLIRYIYSEPAKPIPNRKQKSSAGGALAMIVEGSLVIVVGGLHLAALKVHFPTPLESYIWIGSSIGMIFFPFVIVVIAAFTRYERDLSNILWKVHFGGIRHRDLVPYVFGKIHKICIDHTTEKAQKYKERTGLDLSRVNKFFLILGHYLLIYTCLLSLLLYALSTLYVVVESYISLRDPPAGTFRTPRWGDYWPHL